MRRPLNSELSPEDRVLAQRWATIIGSIYLGMALVIVLAGALASKGLPPSGAELASSRAEPGASLQQVGALK